MSDNPFPDVRWGSEKGAMRRFATTFASTRFGSWAIRTATPLDRTLLQRSRGRVTILGPIGAPTVLLTTTGRKTGQPRVSPLLYIRDGERLVVVGTNFGQSTHPAWTANLLANPDAAVTLGGKTILVSASAIHGTEHDDLYARFIDMMSLYGNYRQATNRAIRMFALTAQ